MIINNIIYKKKYEQENNLNFQHIRGGAVIIVTELNYQLILFEYQSIKRVEFILINLN